MPVASLSSELLQQRLGLLEISGVKALGEPAVDRGQQVVHLRGCFVLLYTSQVVCQGRLTMEEIIFSLKHYWRFVDSEPLELKALSHEVGEKDA